MFTLHSHTPHKTAGVSQQNHVYFLKQLADARAIRGRIIECFERASYPGTPLAEQARLLSFLVVGGGPTSVELSSELYDFLRNVCRDTSAIALSSYGHQNVPHDPKRAIHRPTRRPPHSITDLSQDVHKWYPDLEVSVGIGSDATQCRYILSS